MSRITNLARLTGSLRQRALLALSGVFFCLVLLAGLGGYPTLVGAMEPKSDDLAALRFVIVGHDVESSPSGDAVTTARADTVPPVGAAGFSVWIDGKRRVNGLSYGVASPSLLVAPGGHQMEIRSTTMTLFGTPVDAAGGSSTTYVVLNSTDGSQLIPVTDTTDTGGDHSVAFLNLSKVPVNANVSGTSVSVAPSLLSAPVRMVKGAEPVIQIAGRRIAVDPKNRTSRLFVIDQGAGEFDLRTSEVSWTRYPASMLLTGDAAPGGMHTGDTRPPEFWLRRILSAFVVVLVVAATLATLKSFRAQALDSRVRARME